MKKRCLLLLAVLAATLVLVLPGTALAVYESETVVGLPADYLWNLDTGGEAVELSDAHIWLQGGGGNEGQVGSFSLNTWQEMAPVEWYWFQEDTFESITYADLADIEWEVGFERDIPSPFVVRTALGNVYKLQVITGADWTGLEGWVWKVQRLQPVSNDPPTLLGNLSAFIIAPTVGTIDPVIAPSLTAKVNSALAALARGNENDAKVAMNNLKALVNQVEAQTDKKISWAAADAIIAQVNAIVDALGY